MVHPPRHAAPAEVSARELARALEAGEPLQVLDVRAPERVAAGSIGPLPDGRFHAVPGSRVLASDDPAALGLAPGVPVVVACGHGNSSRRVVAHLEALGCAARSLRGGMAAWMALLVPRELEAPPGLDRLLQIDRPGKGALGYLLVSDGQALAVDPPRDASVHLDAAHDADARLIGVLDTHVHADYVSGGPRLARLLGVPYHLHPADAVYPYDGTPGRVAIRPLEDGDTLAVGRCRLRVQHTPGHTEGSVCLLAGDDLALTGDLIFVASVGRPDLAGKTREWTAALWESLAAAKREWSPGALVLPAHYADESERRADRTVAAPFGELLVRNAGLAFEEREAFARWVEERAGEFPAAYRRIKAVNVGLAEVDEREAEELEVGRNECALGRR